MEEQEIWKVYKVYKMNYLELVHKGDKLYFSNLGRCKLNDKIIEPHLHFNYLMAKNIWIHRAVAELFIPNPERKKCVDHINGNKLDNRACNLRWCTHSENNNYRFELNPYKRSEQGNINIREGCKKRGEEWLNNVIAAAKKESRNKKISDKLKNREILWKDKVSSTMKEKYKSGHLIPPGRNKHRVYDNEEHTKWHMVAND